MDWIDKVMKRMKVVSREYKIMMDHRLFVDRKPAIMEFLAEIKALASQIGVNSADQVSKPKRRQVVFLDTPDFSIYLNGLIFRQRTDLDLKLTEYTLKSRSPDRYLAGSANIQPNDEHESEIKLEEDISAPFQVRFSHSGKCSGPLESPKTLGEASQMFPGLGELNRDGQICSPDIKIKPVNAMTACERVIKGPKLTIGNVIAESAIIFWSNGKEGRPMVAEFSFRYSDKTENYSGETVKTAKILFESMQRLDWFLPDGKPKTQFVYQANSKG
jgi:hypothetical protein